MNIASPCINVCRMNGDTGLCAGCYRSIDEIARWGGLCDADKLRVLDAVDARRLALGEQVSAGRTAAATPAGSSL